MHFRHYKRAGVSFGVFLHETSQFTRVHIALAFQNRKDQFSRRKARELMILRLLSPDIVQQMGLQRNVYSFLANGRVSLKSLFQDLEKCFQNECQRPTVFGGADEVCLRVEDYCRRQRDAYSRDMENIPASRKVRKAREKMRQPV